MKFLLLGLFLSSCTMMLPRRERDREAMIDCAKRLYDVGMSEEGVQSICNDAMGKLSK
jgi:hypothetical protein